MKIAIMSDSHENWTKLSQAIAIANEKGCEYLLFAGDLIAPPGIKILEQFDGQIKFVWGNNEMEQVNMTRKMDASEKIELCDDIFEGELGGVKIFMNHYPRIGELAAKSGEFDVCIHGHTHEYREETVGNTLLLNPGEIQGYATGTSTFMILDTESKSVEKITV
ncbi:MAG: metallophosphoesterase [Candidatus Dojkabacteria bacterium]|nr:MAG: metallophosphoesterase [Candidatus Dojkabacteria bacterium]